MVTYTHFEQGCLLMLFHNLNLAILSILGYRRMYQSLNNQIFARRFLCEYSYHTLMQNKTLEMRSPGRRCLSLIPFQHRSVCERT